MKRANRSITASRSRRAVPSVWIGTAAALQDRFGKAPALSAAGGPRCIGFVVAQPEERVHWVVRRQFAPSARYSQSKM